MTASAAPRALPMSSRRHRVTRPLQPTHTSMNIPPALAALSYRYPSVLVDAVQVHEPGRRIVAVKNVTVNEDYFQGHFPGAPLLPAVLMIETLAQVATMLVVYKFAPLRPCPANTGLVLPVPQ